MRISDDTFEQDLLSFATPVLLIFVGSFCGPSFAMQPMLEEASDEYTGDIEFLFIDVEDFPRLTNHLQIKGTPTIMLLKPGAIPVASRIGTQDDDQLYDWLEENLEKC